MQEIVYVKSSKKDWAVFAILMIVGALFWKMAVQNYRDTVPDTFNQVVVIPEVEVVPEMVTPEIVEEESKQLPAIVQTILDAVKPPVQATIVPESASTTGVNEALNTLLLRKAECVRGNLNGQVRDCDLEFDGAIQDAVNNLENK